jgi:CRP-like cAMP-binding protein/general stress protein 26
MADETSKTDLPGNVLEYLHEQKTLTLATASRGAVPHAVTLVYVDHDGSLYFWTRPDTTTAQHIGQNPVVSFAIAEYSSDWRDTKGVQGSGNCQVVLDSEEIDRVVAAFGAKYPSLDGSLSNELSFFRITPTQLQFIDNTAPGAASDQGPGVSYYRDLVYSIFHDLPQDQVETVEGQLRTIEVPEGDVIVRQGAPADKFFIIVDGEVEVTREADGKTRSLGTLGRGQFFGEIAILRDTPRVATVRALKPTILFSMERDVFRSVVAQSMGTTGDFDRLVTQRLEDRGHTIVG